MEQYIYSKIFQANDINEIRKFVQQNSFNILMTTKKGKPIATHFPMQLVKEQTDYYITGHMAYGNPQWRKFRSSEDVLVMFQGPHAYISSSWYEQENVPTWNYQAVHIYGTPALLDKEELKQDLAKLLEKHENPRENPVLQAKLPPNLVEKEMEGIVGFKIKIGEIQAAYKLSQNRTEKDYSTISKQSKNEGRQDSIQMAELTQKRLNAEL